MTTKPRQSLIDIAVAACGSAHTAIQIAILNGLSLSDDIAPGTDIIVPSVDNSKVVAFFATTPPPGTALEVSPEDSEIMYGGINYMGIGTDFVVSGYGGINYMGIEINFAVS